MPVIFGAVLSIIPLGDDDMIALANAADARLTAYAYPTNVSRADKLSRELAFGVVGINDPRFVACLAPQALAALD